MPWNQQNHMGLMLLELYKATGEDKYLDRCEELIAAHRKEWVTLDDGCQYWHYWPLSFYEGWTESDGKSSHTPSRDASTDELLEDTSHSAVTARFLAEYCELVPDGVVSLADIEHVSEAPNHFCSSGGFSQYIDGGGRSVGQDGYSWFIQPGYDWCVFANDNLSAYFENTVPNVLAEWDSQGKLFAHMLLFDPDEPMETIGVERVLYSSDGEQMASQFIDLERGSLKSYASQVVG